MTTDLSLDVLLVTAVSSEFDALKAVAKVRGLPWTRRRGATVEYFHLGTIGNDRVGVLKLKKMGSFSETGSAFTCFQAQRESRATSLIAVGIAFGVDPSRQKVGDLLISEGLFLYDEGDVVDDTTRGHRYDYSNYPAVVASSRWVGRCRSVSPALGVTAHFGRLLAGGARVASQSFRDELVQRAPVGLPPIVGGEMEGAGIAAACAAAAADWIVIKAVSDFATAESHANRAQTRGDAASSAARFAFDVLQVP